MEDLIVYFLKLCLLVFFIFFIGIMVDGTFKRLGFYKRNWILNGIFSLIAVIFSVIFFFVLSLSVNSYKALRGNFFFLAYFLGGFIIVCGLIILLRNIFRKKKVIFVFPRFKDIFEEDTNKLIKHFAELRKNKYEIHFYTVESLINKTYCLDKIHGLIGRFFEADEIHIWYTDYNRDEVNFVLGVCFSFSCLFWRKKIVLVNGNGGHHFLDGTNLGKILFGLEWSGF